jgi:hypothetical protein
MLFSWKFQRKHIKFTPEYLLIYLLVLSRLLFQIQNKYADPDHDIQNVITAAFTLQVQFNV